MKKFIFLLGLSIGLMSQAVYASSEFYLRINLSGTHTVTIGDQMQTSPTNEFRFHGLSAGTWTFSVTSELDKSIKNFSITLYDSYRTVAEVGNLTTLTILGNLQFQLSTWYSDQFIIGFGNGQMATAVDETTFAQIKQYVASETYDSYRVTAAKEVTKSNSLSGAQIGELCKLFDYDSYRLEYAKYAYKYCINKGTYFLVYQTFDYDSYSSSLRDYVLSYQ